MNIPDPQITIVSRYGFLINMKWLPLNQTPVTVITYIRDWQILYFILNILGVMDPTTVSVKTTQFCHCGKKGAMDNTWTVRVVVSNKTLFTENRLQLYLVGHSLPTPPSMDFSSKNIFHLPTLPHPPKSNNTFRETKIIIHPLLELTLCSRVHRDYLHINIFWHFKSYQKCYQSPNVSLNIANIFRKKRFLFLKKHSGFLSPTIYFRHNFSLINRGFHCDLEGVRVSRVCGLVRRKLETCPCL